MSSKMFVRAHKTEEEEEKGCNSRIKMRLPQSRNETVDLGFEDF